MRRTSLRQRGRRDCRKSDRLADQPPPGLLEHQGELGEAETQAIGSTRNEDAEPAELPRLP